MRTATRLVIDTIGLADKGGRGPIDRFRTPHTNQLHVVERYRLHNAGKNIEVSFTVEDPGTFTMPWKAKVDFQRRLRRRVFRGLDGIDLRR